jgi:hypothetical protein
MSNGKDLSYGNIVASLWPSERRVDFSVYFLHRRLLARLISGLAFLRAILTGPTASSNPSFSSHELCGQSTHQRPTQARFR